MAKILAVDDDEDLSEMISDWLTFEGHSVTVANSGFQAWKCLQSEAFDVVILDWDLGDVNGIEVLKRFRATGGMTPVIILTGRSSVDDKLKGLDTGADDYLTKPFHIEELAARIRVAMRKQAAPPAALKPLGSDNEAVLSRADLSGTQLAAHYEFLDVIGEGAIGIVFKARHPHLDKLVAIKMLQATEMKDETIERFQREARAISRLEHANIATVYDFGVTERKRPYMVMEYIDGLSLDELIKDEGALPLGQALEILIPVCDGVAHAHQAGIVHRDIKPSNIMLKPVSGRAPVPKILDFGCAKVQAAKSPAERALTQAGYAFGSPPYMSPEQVRGKVLDERSDIYSLGCVLYEAITGRLPYDDENVVEIMFKHLEDRALLLKEARPDLSFPEELEKVVRKTLEKDPANRYQSVSELKQALVLIESTLRAQGQ